jgi:hypothetical protein
MDCIIPGHSVRPFCAAIGCLSRVGKELYIDFDPIDGLTLRALNDSKSVFSSFHYDPSFFQRCSFPPVREQGQRPQQRHRKRKHATPSQTGITATQGDDDDRWSVRVAMKALAAIIRPRKDVLSLQLLTTGDLLAFGFQLQRPHTNGVIVRVTHKVGVATAPSVAAVASMTGSSELVVQPSVLLTMLEPLRRASEMALLVNETHKLVSSVTFAHDDISPDQTNPLAKPASLKTETSIAYDELVDLHYVSHYSSSPEEENEPIPPPDNLKEQVVLVFTTKEFKALLQFCAQAHIDQELPVTVQFFWGGKPMVVTTSSNGFTAQLVMATLDHKLLGAMKPNSAGQE